MPAVVVVMLTAMGLSVIVAADEDLVGSLTLVATSETETGELPEITAGALYVTPVPVTFVSVPTPEPMLQVTPELEPSFDTATVNAWVPPPARATVPGLGAPTLIGVSVTVTLADLVVSVLLVAVTVAEVTVITAGAVYTPAVVIVPVLALHVTPALAPSAATVAAKVCEAPPIIATGVVVMDTLIGVNVMVALADLVLSLLLVAVTVADVVVMTAGAVYTPVLEILPVVAVHVAPALAESLVTVAVKVCVAPPIRVAEVGLTDTEIVGAGAEPPPHPAMTKRRNTEMAARSRV